VAVAAAVAVATDFHPAAAEVLRLRPRSSPAQRRFPKFPSSNAASTYRTLLHVFPGPRDFRKNLRLVRDSASFPKFHSMHLSCPEEARVPMPKPDSKAIKMDSIRPEEGRACAAKEPALKARRWSQVSQQKQVSETASQALVLQPARRLLRVPFDSKSPSRKPSVNHSFVRAFPVFPGPF
jgi:hypothetical protein